MCYNWGRRIRMRLYLGQYKMIALFLVAWFMNTWMREVSTHTYTYIHTAKSRSVISINNIKILPKAKRRPICTTNGKMLWPKTIIIIHDDERPKNCVASFSHAVFVCTSFNLYHYLYEFLNTGILSLVDRLRKQNT